MVKGNMERILDPAPGSEHRARFAGIVQGVQTPDKYTVQYYLTKPYPPFFSEMTDRPGLMVSSTAAQKYGPDFGRNPVGTGPFRFGFQYLTTAPRVSLAPGVAIFLTVFVFNQLGDLIRDALDPRALSRTKAA